MPGLKQQLIAEANLAHQRRLAAIDSHIHHADAGRAIVKEWRQRSMGRRATTDTSPHILPILTHLWLGPLDRLDRDVNLFVEEMEERFGLEFHEADIGDDNAIVFRYGPYKLTMIFHLHSAGTCRVVTEKTEPMTTYKYKRQIVCD